MPLSVTGCLKVRRASARLAAALAAGVLGLWSVLVLMSWLQPTPAVRAAAPAAARPDQLVLADSPVFTLYLPLIFHDYALVIPPVGVQMYGDVSAGNGLTRVVESHTTWVRVPIAWSALELANTTPDQYAWDVIDASLQNLRDHNIQAMITIGDNPQWASRYAQGPVTNTADLLEFVGALVARYPHVYYWEFYNEPDNAKFFGLNGAGYAAMLTAVYPVVKAANPAANVVLGGLALDRFIDQGGIFDRDFLRDVLLNCTQPCFDVANFHYYPYFRSNWEPYGRDLLGKANYVSQTLAAYGYPRPLMMSETGWPSFASWGSPELQASYVPKAYVRAYAAPLLAAVWYALGDADSGNPGLIDRSLYPRAAYTALLTLNTVLTDARLVRIIPSGEIGFPNVEGYQFTVPGGSVRKRVDVYWYDCPSLYQPGAPVDCDGVAPLYLTATRVAKIDKLGNRQIVEDEDDGYRDGRVTLGVLSSPIFIDYAP